MISSDKPLIAIFTVLPPSYSGIAVYSSALIDELKNIYNIHVFTNKKKCNCNNDMHSHLCFSSMRRNHRYKAIIYQMGNDDSFNFMYPYIGYYPGIVILHDINLYQSRAKYLISKHRYKEYIEEMYYCHGYAGKKFAEASLKLPIHELMGFAFSMNKLIIDCSLAIGVHTKYYQDELLHFYPEKKIYYIPMSLGRFIEDRLFKDLEKTELKKADEILLGSAGFVNHHKGLLSILKAIINLRSNWNVKFVWIGEDSNNIISNLIEKNFDDQAKKILKENIKITGYVDDCTLIKFIKELDIFINLRYPTAGEFSGVLWLAMHLGKAIIMSDLPHLIEIPKEYVYKVDISNELESLIEGLNILIADKSKKEYLGNAIKKFALDNYTIEKTIEAYKLMIIETKDQENLLRIKKLPAHWSILSFENLYKDEDMDYFIRMKNLDSLL